MKISFKTLMLGFAATLIFYSCKKHDQNNQETLNAQDQTFIRQAALGNSAEIQLGQFADSTADSSIIKNFAAQLVSDHQAAQNDLKSLGTKLNVAVLDSMDSSHTMMLDSFRMLSGRAFDSSFIINQINDHNKAISDYQAEIDQGNRTEVINYANQYLPKLQQHLNMADSIASAMHFK